MNSFQLKYHKCSVLIAAFIGVPSIGALLMFFVLFCLPIDTPLWIISTLIASFLLVMILALRWIIKTQIFVACQVQSDSRGIKFTIERGSLFYSKRSFYSIWEDIYSIEEKFSNQNGDYYYAVGFNKPLFCANFSMQENFEQDAEEFFKQLRVLQDNQTLSKLQVHKNYKIVKQNIFATG